MYRYNAMGCAPATAYGTPNPPNIAGAYPLTRFGAETAPTQPTTGQKVSEFLEKKQLAGVANKWWLAGGLALGVAWYGSKEGWF